MKTRMAVLATFVAMASLAQADPRRDDKDAVKAAVHQLSQQANYSWTVFVSRDEETDERFAFGPCEGRAEKGGCTWIRTKDTTPIEAVFKGGKMAVRLEDGWASEKELGGQGRRRAQAGAAVIRSLKGYPHPPAQAEELFKHAMELKSVVAGYFTSPLGAEEAKDLLHRSLRTSGRAPKISDAAGTVAFWVKDGILVKYETHLQGTVTFDPSGSPTWSANSTRTVELYSIGTTKVDLPDDALKKLE
jgi:hypothetical protein